MDSDGDSDDDDDATTTTTTTTTPLTRHAVLSELAETVAFLTATLPLDRLAQVEKELRGDADTEGGLWDTNAALAGRLERERARLVETKEEVEHLAKQISTVAELADLAEMEADDEVMREALAEIDALRERARKLKIKSMLSGPADSFGCYIEVSAGAGGTESMDFAQMLLRMYQGWAERHGFSCVEKEITPGPDAGIRSGVVQLDSPDSYGWLRGEAGTHRIIRISPFSAKQVRHTSFAQVAVYPLNPDLKDADVDLKDSELRVDTFRASGPGGQGVNTTSSAVRVTHLPTGIAVACQSERSQHRNKAEALAMLRSRLLERKLKERAAAESKVRANLGEASFGTQMRSYYFNPKAFVKDHRSGLMVHDTASVLSGERLDEYLEAYLEWEATLSMGAKAGMAGHLVKQAAVRQSSSSSS